MSQKIILLPAPFLKLCSKFYLKVFIFSISFFCFFLEFFLILKKKEFVSESSKLKAQFCFKITKKI